MSWRATARSTALASVMHHHVVLFTAWRYRRGLPGAEATLRRVADEGIVLVSTGGADLTRPRGRPTKADGGYLVSGRKIFASQAPVGNVMSTMFPFEDPDEGLIVLNMAVPMAARASRSSTPGTPSGMRGTGSHDIEIKDVFVPDERVLARRPARQARPPAPGHPQQRHAARSPPSTSGWPRPPATTRWRWSAAPARADDPLVQRQIGLMDTRLRVACWALDGALAIVGDDPEPSHGHRRRRDGRQARDRARPASRCASWRWTVGGGAAFYRTQPIEQCFRDVQGARFHPLAPEETLVHAGTVALGLPADEA